MARCEVCNEWGHSALRCPFNEVWEEISNVNPTLWQNQPTVLPPRPEPASFPVTPNSPSTSGDDTTPSAPPQRDVNLIAKLISINLKQIQFHC